MLKLNASLDGCQIVADTCLCCIVRSGGGPEWVAALVARRRESAAAAVSALYMDRRGARTQTQGASGTHTQTHI